MLGLQIKTIPDPFLNVNADVVTKTGLAGAAKIAHDDVLSRTPIGKTGKTYDETILTRESESSYIIHAKTDATAENIARLEYGTKPHPIPLYPKPPGKFLRWFDGSETRFAKQVFHPGTKALHYFHISSQAIKKMVDFIREIKIIG